MDDDPGLATTVSLDTNIEKRQASAAEVELIAAFLPELLKDMLAQPQTEGE